MSGRNHPAELHSWVEARLSDYIDQQLAPNERARVEQHLAECALCRASLESLRWTIALVKQAPVPAARRSFALPVPVPRSQPSFGFAFARLATAMATLALVATIGIDVITRMGAGAPTSVMAPAAEKLAEPTQVIALAPTFAPQPTEASRVGIASESAPSAVPPAPAFAATLPPAPTKAPAPLPFTSAVSPTQSADSAKAQTQPARAPAAGSGIITPTIVAPTVTIAPTQTATPVPPTATPAPTMVAQVQREPVAGAPVAQTAPLLSPFFIIEIGLFFAVIFFGTLTVLKRKR